MANFSDRPQLLSSSIHADPYLSDSGPKTRLRSPLPKLESISDVV
jgi:hypothetical protein